MSPIGGVLFLLVGVGIFILGIVYLVARERVGQRPKHTVEHYQRSRGAMRKLYRHQLAVREARRARARQAHPAAAKPRRHRKSA